VIVTADITGLYLKLVRKKRRMILNRNRSKNDMPGERLLFTIRGSVKRRILTAAVFGFFTLITLTGAFVLKSVTVTVLGVGAMIMSFWPLTDAYNGIEVTNLRIRYSEFSKFTAKTEDVPLDRLALCSETSDGSKIELLFLIDDSKTPQSIRCLKFDKADENAILLTQLPCAKQEDLKQILETNYK
jgi:hypothetical protein